MFCVEQVHSYKKPHLISVGWFVLSRSVLPVIPELKAGRRYHNLYLTCLWVIIILTYINATFNFVVYYTMGSRYRHTFWALFGRKNVKRESSKTFEDETSVQSTIT